MWRSAEQHPFPSPMAALDFIEELAKQTVATTLIKELVESGEWRKLQSIVTGGEGAIRIEKFASTSDAGGLSERLVVSLVDDLQVAWVIRSDKELLRLEIASEQTGGSLWERRCAVCLHWEEGAPENLLYVKEWIDNNRTLARIRDGAQDLARSLSMHD